MTLSMVDLPQPDGPTMETNSPSLTVRLTPSRAWVAPKAMERFETETFGGTLARLLVPEMLELGGHDLVVRDVAFDRAHLLLRLVAEVHGFLGDLRVVRVLLDGDDGANERHVEGGKDLLAHSHRGLRILAHAPERLDHSADELLGRLGIRLDESVARLKRRERH